MLLPGRPFRGWKGLGGLVPVYAAAVVPLHTAGRLGWQCVPERPDWDASTAGEPSLLGTARLA